MGDEMVWKDTTGTYKLGYSQKLQADTVKELKIGNIFRIVIAIMLLLNMLLFVVIIKSNIVSIILKNMVC